MYLLPIEPTVNSQLLSVPPGTKSAKAGALNLGLKDQRLALEWVQKNIEYFGGDKTKVSYITKSRAFVLTTCRSPCLANQPAQLAQLINRFTREETLVVFSEE
jgi:carboxylesterase type B